MRRLELLDEAVVALFAVGLEVFGPLAPKLALRGAPDERVAVADEPQVGGVELLGLDEHLFAHADFAEVVQEGGIADLFQLFAREAHAAIWTVARTVHHLREPHGHARHPAAVTIGRRIAL